MASRKKGFIQQEQQKRFYGWKKGPTLPVENRYVPQKSFLPLPPEVDLESKCPEVYAQLKLGSCTVNASGSLAQYIMKKNGHIDYMPSRLAMYWYGRFLEKNVENDWGTSLRTAMDTLVKLGVPHEEFWPYDVSKFREKPTKPAWTDGYWHTIKTAYEVDQNVTIMKKRLNEGFPFIFGFNVFDSFEYKMAERNFVMQMPSQGETIHFGHAVMAVGYNDELRAFKIRNSWGKEWAKNGHFYMPYDFIDNPEYCSDFWTAHEYLRFKV